MKIWRILLETQRHVKINQVEILENKNKVSEMKYSIYRINKLDTTGEMISELENRSKEIIQFKADKKSGK